MGVCRVKAVHIQPPRRLRSSARGHLFVPNGLLQSVHQRHCLAHEQISTAESLSAAA